MAEIRCPKCGSRMIIPMTKGDDLRHYVCSNRPTCTERIAVEDAWAYMWEEGKPVSKAAKALQQSKKSPQSGAGNAGRILGEGGLLLGLIFKRPKPKDKAPVHAVQGRHSDGKKHEQKLPPYLPQRPKTQKKQAASAVKETSKPGSPVVPKTADGEQRQRIKQPSPGREDGRGDEIPATRDVVNKTKLGGIPQAASRETEPVKTRDVTHDKPKQTGASEKKADSERKELPKPWAEPSHEEEVVSEKKTEIHKGKKPSRYWWQRAAREEPSSAVKEPPKTQQSGAPSDEIFLKREEPAGPWLPTVPNREVAHQTEELSSSQPPIALKTEIVPEAEELPKPRPRPLLALKKLSTRVKRLFRHWWRRAPEREAAPDKPVAPVAPEVYETDRAEESLRPQPLGVMQSDMDARKKKRSLIIIIIILIAITVAWIVVMAGMFYTVLVSR